MALDRNSDALDPSSSARLFHPGIRPSFWYPMTLTNTPHQLKAHQLLKLSQLIRIIPRQLHMLNRNSHIVRIQTPRPPRIMSLRHSTICVGSIALVYALDYLTIQTDNIMGRSRVFTLLRRFKEISDFLCACEARSSVKNDITRAIAVSSRKIIIIGYP